jgi:hypothetical protein
MLPAFFAMVISTVFAVIFLFVVAGGEGREGLHPSLYCCAPSGLVNNFTNPI